MDTEKDFFDRIFELPGFRFFLPFYKTHKEMLLYLFFGALTTLVSIISFAFLVKRLHMDAMIANVISWILAVAFAYFTNRSWVFSAKPSGLAEGVRQAGAFFGGRILTLILEEGILFLFLNILHFSAIPTKIAAQLLVLIANYGVSKLFVFRKRDA
ncbi:GtrA family protein [Peptoniphilaceae bacterium SGI.137]|nr:GtrA family protein [Peptoniphilaceae bacterium]MDY4196421.1 GtrA family protein [Peptoniphilaceae bacterium]